MKLYLVHLHGYETPAPKVWDFILGESEKKLIERFIKDFKIEGDFRFIESREWEGME